MNISYKKIFALISLFIFIVFTIFVINQTAQVVELSKTISEDFSRFVLFSLITIYFVLVSIPIYLILSLPKSLKLPESENTGDYQKYINALKKRLNKNPILKEKNIFIRSDDDLKLALEELNQVADKEIKSNAVVIFTTTAISQSGRLDALLILITLTKMIYRVAKIYNQRPRISELIQLYANVFTTSFIAYSIEEIDISEQIEPITDNLAEISVMKALQSIPASKLVANMLLDGAINAYLAIRVGIIAKTYCSSLVKPERRLLRRSAAIQAAKLTVLIIKEFGETIAKKIGEKLKNKVAQTGETILEKGKELIDKSKNFFRKLIWE